MLLSSVTVRGKVAYYNTGVKPLPPPMIRALTGLVGGGCSNRNRKGYGP